MEPNWSRQNDDHVRMSELISWVVNGGAEWAYLAGAPHLKATQTEELTLNLSPLEDQAFIPPFWVYQISLVVST